MTFKNGKPIIRCSSLDQLLKCPGSRTVVAALGEIEEDDSGSWEGQWCHFQAALRFVQMHGAVTPNAPRVALDGTVIDIGLPPPRIPKDYKPDAFAEWIVDYYFRAVMEQTPATWAMEVEAEMIYEFPNFWLSGHVDVNAVAPDASAVQFDDLKSGVIVVTAAECNEQVFGYAGLFKLAYGDALKSVRGRIIQPRVKESEGKRITGVTINEQGTFDDAGEMISEATINDLVPSLERRINAALANPMELNTGLKQCRWCPGARPNGCPAYEKEIERMKMELTKEALAAIKATPDDAALARWTIAKRMLSGNLDKAATLMKERLEKIDGHTFETDEGVKLTLAPWNGQRSFPSEKKAEVWTAIVNDLDEERAYACMDLSPAEMEKAYAKQLGLVHSTTVKEKDSGEKQVLNRFGGFWTRPTGKQLTIVG